ncbi:MAG: carboxypeptidase-like regulatory domain-containing protein, partial [Bacteroidia bacterium]|nr:carboxypeptidase-like regulatory domain-containing protein [Bacteroidia bacterium]
MFRNVLRSGFTVILVFGLSVVGFSQDFTQTIRGKLIDRDTKLPLIGATIAIYQDTTMLGGSATDENGKFRIEVVPVGRHILKVSFIGYNDLIIPNVLVSTGKEVVLELELEESSIEM